MIVQFTSAAVTARVKLSSLQLIPPEPHSEPAQNLGLQPSADAPEEPTAPTPTLATKVDSRGREQENRECHPRVKAKHPNASVYHFKQHLSQASNH